MRQLGVQRKMTLCKMHGSPPFQESFMQRRHLLQFAAALAAPVLGLPGAAQAQSFPSRPVKLIVVPFKSSVPPPPVVSTETELTVCGPGFMTKAKLLKPLETP